MTNPMESNMFQKNEEETALYKPLEPAFSKERIHNLPTEALSSDIFDIYKEQTLERMMSNVHFTDKDIVKLENNITLVNADDINTIGAKKYTFTMNLEVSRDELSDAYEKQMAEKIEALQLPANNLYSVYTMDSYYQVYDQNDPSERKFFTGGLLVNEGEPTYKK